MYYRQLSVQVRLRSDSTWWRRKCDVMVAAGDEDLKVPLWSVLV